MRSGTGAGWLRPGHRENGRASHTSHPPLCAAGVPLAAQPEGETNPLKFSQTFHLAPMGGSFVVTNGGGLLPRAPPALVACMALPAELEAPACSPCRLPGSWANLLNVFTTVGAMMLAPSVTLLSWFCCSRCARWTLVPCRPLPAQLRLMHHAESLGCRCSVFGRSLAARQLQ